MHIKKDFGLSGLASSQGYRLLYLWRRLISTDNHMVIRTHCTLLSGTCVQHSHIYEELYSYNTSGCVCVNWDIALLALFILCALSLYLVSPSNTRVSVYGDQFKVLYNDRFMYHIDHVYTRLHWNHIRLLWPAVLNLHCFGRLAITEFRMYYVFLPS